MAPRAFCFSFPKVSTEVGEADGMRLESSLSDGTMELSDS